MGKSTLDAVLLKWTGYDDLSKIETSLLAQCVAENAYSASLQLLLTKKYALEGSDKYTTQLQKTTSFFPSTLQLLRWLAKEESADIVASPNMKLNTIVSDQFAQYKDPVVAESLVFEKNESATQKDYFRDQGIEIDLSKIPQDKFTTQLRSFTAWLKVLKNQDGNSQPIHEIVADQELIITKIAEKANNAPEIITEAMAKIWEQQGNYNKAIAIYSKLSFIFPEKSVYFASLIEQLKQINK